MVDVNRQSTWRACSQRATEGTERERSITLSTWRPTPGSCTTSGFYFQRDHFDRSFGQIDQPAGGQQHGDGAGDLQEDERGVHRGDEAVQLPRGRLHVGQEQTIRLAHCLDPPDLQRRCLPGSDILDYSVFDALLRIGRTSSTSIQTLSATPRCGCSTTSRLTVHLLRLANKIGTIFVINDDD